MKVMDGALFKRCVTGAYQLLDEKKEEVNTLNVFPVPDGDTGTNMSLTMQSAIKQVDSLESDRVDKIASAIGMGSLMGARGNSGVILSQLCRGLADSLEDKEVISLKDFDEMFSSASEKAYKAVMKPTEGTMLTVARAMSEYTTKNISHYQSIPELLADVLAYASMVLDQTPDMLPALKKANVVDAGGQGLIYLLAGFLSVLTGQKPGEFLDRDHLISRIQVEQTSLDPSYTYKVKAVLADTKKVSRKLSKELNPLVGRLIEEVKDKDLYLSLETDHLIDVLSLLSTFEKIAYLEVFDKSKGLDLVESSIEDESFDKEYGFVAVSLGSGFNEVFESLMVDEIVTGGQTMNPSTQDLYEAVKKVSAENVFILPNNKNIIMAAEQVDDLTGKNVYVVPTRSIPQGFTALFNFDPQSSAEENLENMTASLETIVTGQITYAVRDTEVNGLSIKENDFIGMLDGDIVAVDKNKEQLLLELLKQSINDESSLVTVYFGEDLEEDMVNKMEVKLGNEFDQVDIECIYGNQPTYYYIFSVE